MTTSSLYARPSRIDDLTFLIKSAWALFVAAAIFSLTVNLKWEVAVNSE